MADPQHNLSEEVWKEIPGFTGYEVSDHGRVRSYWGKAPDGFNWETKKEVQRLLKPWRTGVGYFMVKLYRSGKRYQLLLHRLVLHTFVGPCPPDKEACHADGKRGNNGLSNLRWDTKQGNWNDKRRHGTACIGNRHGRSKLTDKEVLIIRELVSNGYSQKEVGGMFSVLQPNMSRIILRKTWAHVP